MPDPSSFFIRFKIINWFPIISPNWPILYAAAAAAAKSLQSCPTLCDPIDRSPPGSPIPGILQARTLEWVAISFSNAWKWKVESESEVAQSCPTPSDPMDCSLPGSSIHGIFWTTVLEWGAIAFYHSFNDIFLNIIFYCLFTLLLENMIPVKHLSLFPNVSYQCYSFLILILFYHLIGLYVSYSFYHATSSKTVS